MTQLITSIDPILIAACMGSLFLFTLIYFGYQSFSQGRSRSEVQKRLEINRETASSGAEKADELNSKSVQKKVAKKMAKKTNDFYSTSDPDSMRKMQLRLIQAGYMNPNAVGYFLAARFGAGAVGFLIGVVLILTSYASDPLADKMIVLMLAGTAGYFAPNFILNQKISKLQFENRMGFPDVMDLMVVAAEAGLTIEASVERIAKEISRTYPNLSTQLNIAALEIRAGRPLDQSLHAFGERLGLEEIKGFATMVQQSKELGTSVSDALKVYSDEMRHKRMMKAEEKAYALPAKLSIPVTVFILPIVIGVAVIPTAVRLMTGEH